MAQVSIHIVTFNNKSTITSCIKSVKKQTHKRWKLLVIDNNSADQTVNILKRLKCQVIHNSKNIGYAAAHNQALKLTKSEYVLTLNPDVALDPEFLTEMVKAIENGGDQVSSAAGLLTRVSSLNNRSSIIDGAGLLMRKNRRQRLRHETQKLNKAETIPTAIFGPDGAAAFYKRAMLEDIKINGEYFDEDFFMHKEDVDVCWRAQLFGWTSLFVPTATARHIRTFRAGQRRHISNFLKMIAVRNRYFMMIKNEILALLLRDIFYILIYEFGIFLYILIKEPSSLAAYVQTVDKLGKMLKKRRWIQSNRVATPSYMDRWFQ